MKKIPFSGSLSQLDMLVKKAGLHLGDETVPAPSLTPPPKPEPPGEEREEEVFAQAMEGVAPAAWGRYRVTTPPPAVPVVSDVSGEERRLMEAAVAGDPPLTVLDHPEYIEGWVGVAARRYLPNLRNGLYSIQGQIDLHGLDREEARQAVEEFVGRMSRFRSCCVKIIHGRGINSPSDRAILKESLQRWLSTRRLSRNVVAYASAPLKDGGVGAIYVLLRART